MTMKKNKNKTATTFKKGWSITRVLELFVLLGSIATVALRMFQNKKTVKK